MPASGRSRQASLLGAFSPDTQSLFFALFQGRTTMFFLYVDESGTPEIPGNSSHYVLAGLSIPVANWKQCEREVAEIKGTDSLSDAEIHTGWLLRPYNEQIKIKRFSELNYADRVNEVRKYRNQHLLKLQSSRKPKQYKQTKKNYRFTQPYVHLTYEERKAFVK